MRRQSAISILLLFGMTFVSVARADEADRRRELEHIINMQLESYKKKDVKAYMKFIAPKFSTTTLEGETTHWQRPVFERQILSDMKDTISIDFVIRDIRELKLDGSEVIVIVNQKSSRVLSDVGTRHKWEFSVLQRERWTKTDEGLKLSSIESLELIYMIQDGKLIKGSKESGVRRSTSALESNRVNLLCP